MTSFAHAPALILRPALTSARNTRHRPPNIRRQARCCTDAPHPPTPTPDAVRALLSSAAKSDQQKGLLLVRQLTPPHALELLLFSVETSRNEFIRSTATIAIGQLDLSQQSVRVKAVDALVSILATDDDYSVRAAAAASMGYVNGVSHQVRVLLSEALKRALLEDAEWQVQFSCLTSLGNLKLSSSVPVLLKWLAVDNDLLVQAAVGALGDIADHTVVPDLLNLLGCDDMMTRQRLAQTLGLMQKCREEPAVIDALRILSKDQSFAVRDAATEALNNFGCRQAAKDDQFSDDQMMEMEVANLMRGDESGNADKTANLAMRRRLERSFDKQYVHDSHFTHDASSSDDHAQASSEHDEAAHPESNEPQLDLSVDRYNTLINQVKHGDLSEQSTAVIHLRKFSAAQIMDAVTTCDLLNPSTASQRLRALSVTLLARGGAMDRIIDVLQNDPDQNVRSACCDAFLDFSENSDAIRACITAFESDAHWLVRISAAIALGSIGKQSSQAEAVLIQSLQTDGVQNLGPPQDAVIQRHAVTALGFIGSQNALCAFESLLESPDTETPLRFRIAAALRGIHCAESVTLVRLLVNDDDEEVADMAQGSLDALAQHGFE